jgi:hypothetical protein
MWSKAPPVAAALLGLAEIEFGCTTETARRSRRESFTVGWEKSLELPTEFVVAELLTSSVSIRPR